MLTPEQRERFEHRGLVRLPGAVEVEAVTAMRNRFWAYLSERGIAGDDEGTWPSETPRRLQALRRAGTFAAMGSEPVRAALNELLGTGGWRSPRNWGLPLVTFPNRDPDAAWTVPITGWHLDSYGPDHDVPGVTVFAFLADVAERGGGTVVLEASHRLVNAHIAATGTWRPADVRAALAAAHPWLREVWAGQVRANEEAVVGGVRVVVRELTGGAGDVVLMHPRTLHAAAPNTGTAPRLMLVEIIDRA
jgi:hypothetical protein